MNVILEYHCKTRTLPAYVELILYSTCEAMSHPQATDHRKLYQKISQSVPMSRSHLDKLENQLRILLTPSQTLSLTNLILQEMEKIWSLSFQPKDTHETTSTIARSLIHPTIWAITLGAISCHIAPPSKQDEFKTVILSATSIVKKRLFLEIEDMYRSLQHTRGILREDAMVESDYEPSWYQMTAISAMLRFLFKTRAIFPVDTVLGQLSQAQRSQLLQCAVAEVALPELQVEIVGLH